MSSLGQRSKIISYSHSLYNKNSQTELSLHTKGSISPDHKLSIGEETYNTLTEFNAAFIDQQREMLSRDAKNIVRAHVVAIVKLDAQKEILNYVLPSLDGILFEMPSAIKFIYEYSDENNNYNLILKLQKILASRDIVYNSIIYDAAAHIVAVLTSDHDHYEEFKEDSRIHLDFIIASGLKSTKILSDYAVCVCLSRMLLVPGMTKYFISRSGVILLKDILEKNLTDLQIMYYALLNIWIMTFDHATCVKFSDPKLCIIQYIVAALKNISREKLTRIAFRIFKNLADFGECIELMVDNNLKKIVENEQRKNIKDPKLRENLEALEDVLERNYRILSSFEKYQKEIDTNQLRWGPCHSENFWKENAKRFEAGDFALVKKLVEFLDSHDMTTRAIACYDLGEFCRFHHFARRVLEGNGGKQKLMGMIQEEETQVRE